MILSKMKNRMQFPKLFAMTMFMLALSGCSNGGGTAVPPSTTTGITGAANLGVAIGATVKAFDWSTGAKGAALAQGVTDAQGNYSLAIPKTQTGAVLLELSDPAGTATFIDEFTGLMSAFPAGVTYRSIMMNPAGSPVAITALSELVTMAAIKKIAAGATAAQAVAAASVEVGAAFLNGADPLLTLPWDFRSPVAGASLQSQQYAAVLAGIQRLATISNVSALAIVQGYEALMYNATGVAGVLPQAEIAKLNQEITSFQTTPPAGLNAAAFVTPPTGSGTLTLVAIGQQVSAIENQPVSITLSASDPAANPLTYSVTTQPLHGTLSGVMPNLTFTPTSAYFGADSFIFQVSNGVTVASATVTLNIQQVFGATPVASDGVASTLEDTAVTGTLTAVDPDNEALTYAIATAPAAAGGTVSISKAGGFVFTPALNFNGTTTFTFTASDPHPNTSNIATVTITVQPVNDAPVANQLNKGATEDVAAPITLAGTDIDTALLNYLVVTPPVHGTLSGIGQAQTYTPNANYNGPDSFTYMVNDGMLNSAVVTVSLNIAPVNDAPVANGQTLIVQPGTPIAITLSGSDVDGDPLSYIVQSAPSAGGTFSGITPGVAGPATFTFNPPASQVADVTSSFTFVASDGALSSPVATVAFTVLGYGSSSADSDNDGLIDMDEVNIHKTNPALADTDGDGFPDGQEVASFNNTPQGIYIFNPLIADIPELDINLLSSPSISINMTATDGTTKTIANTTAVTNTDIVSTVNETADSVKHTIGGEAGASLAITVSTTESASPAPGFSSTQSVTGTITATAKWGKENEHVSTQSFERTTENSRMAEQSDEFSNSHDVAQSGGFLNVAAQVINTGHLSYTLNNLYLTGYYLDLSKADPFVMLGNMAFDAAIAGGGFPAFTLGPNQSAGPINFITNEMPLQDTLNALRYSNAIVVKPSIWEMIDANGIPYAQNYMNIDAQDATVIVDYGPVSGKGRLKKHITTRNTPGASTRTLQSLLVETLGLTVTESFTVSTAGAFLVGDTVVGSTSGASGTVKQVVNAVGTDTITVVVSSGNFSINETLTGWSGAVVGPVTMTAAADLVALNNEVNPATDLTNVAAVAPAVHGSNWMILHAQLQADGTHITTVYATAEDYAYRLGLNPAADMTNWINAPQNLSAINVAAGDVVHMLYVADSDGDGSNDYDEALAGTNAGVADSDGDGLSDAYELKGWDITVGASIVHVTSNPQQKDTDGDGLWDGQEAGFLPLVAPTAGSGVYGGKVDPALAAADPALITDPRKPDTDGDLIPDALDLKRLTSTPVGLVTLTSRTDSIGNAYIAYTLGTAASGVDYKAGTIIYAHVYKQYSATGVFSEAAEIPTAPNLPATLLCDDGTRCWTRMSPVIQALGVGATITDPSAVITATGPESGVRYMVYYRVFDSAAPTLPGEVVKSPLQTVAYAGGTDTITMTVTSVDVNYLAGQPFDVTLIGRSFKENPNFSHDVSNSPWVESTSYTLPPTAGAWTGVKNHITTAWTAKAAAYDVTYPGAAGAYLDPANPSRINLNIPGPLLAQADPAAPPASQVYTISRTVPRIDGACYGFEMSSFDNSYDSSAGVGRYVQGHGYQDLPISDVRAGAWPNPNWDVAGTTNRPLRFYATASNRTAIQRGINAGNHATYGAFEWYGDYWTANVAKNATSGNSVSYNKEYTVGVDRAKYLEFAPESVVLCYSAIDDRWNIQRQSDRMQAHTVALTNFSVLSPVFWSDPPVTFTGVAAKPDPALPMAYVSPQTPLKAQVATTYTSSPLVYILQTWDDFGVNQYNGAVGSKTDYVVSVGKINSVISVTRQ
ncbi:Ig-like domain-containing protein [Mariprofundus sp. EBB-1]|uniref:Ig-like domain-containing protein n=1 Tax=Mariprofundus sp. EBB-1 TaxID=2650971 RepID=UPI001379C802|nr:Ig-like domain-containing protein [Mariprofundus sp. EBB-1]